MWFNIYSQWGFVNSYFQNDLQDYDLYQSNRFIISNDGLFSQVNYNVIEGQKTDTLVKIYSQKIESNTFGSANLDLYLTYKDYKNNGGYVTSLTTIIGVKPSFMDPHLGRPSKSLVPVKTWSAWNLWYIYNKCKPKRAKNHPKGVF